MLIENIHTFIRFLENQGESKDFSPEEIDEAVHRASIDLFMSLKPMYGANTGVNNSLRPFEKSQEVTVSSGIGAFPSDFSQISNFESVVGSTSYRGEIVETADWVERKNDPIAAPSDDDAICLVTAAGLAVEPSTVSKVKVYYLSQPVRPKWAYTLSQDGRDFVFDSGNSIDLDWLETDHNLIVAGTLTYLGVPLRDTLLVQFKQIKDAGSQIRSHI